MTKQEDTTSSSHRDFPSVCIITHPLGSAGENATRTLLEILAAITSITLVTADLPIDSVIRNRHEVTELSKKEAGQSNPFLAAVRFVVNQLRMCVTITRRKEDFILFFGATAYLLPIAWARILGRTVVLEPRGDVPLTLKLSWKNQMPAVIARVLAGSIWAIERLGYHLADGIITYTPAMSAELGLNYFEHKLYPIGARYVDTDQFACQTPLEEREQVVGYLGRIDEEKGIRRLAAIAKILPENITFRFIGDGDLLPWLQRELSEEVATDHVELAGWVNHEEVPVELNRLQLLVMPSSPTEGLPTTILEALACGTPVYATPVSGIPDVVRAGETGFFIEGTDPEEHCEDIIAILDRKDLINISTNCRELIESEYDFEAATARYETILTSLVD